MTQQNNTDNTFQLDDPVNIKGEITPERAAAIIARMNKLMEEERQMLANPRNMLGNP